ncbi:FUSC family protein [Burkholderia vietnamiensis]|uniref:Fusaric acid resistance protein conserved region n=1 Tax=Burkholderia vietnamiensis (strain G4 / LMG 22486) TaxID=269482 RepID=A4JKR7_BURVG|nr:FUSC family protein [Burkholderia vietnamiensis]ABO56870.1 Fusaric acid resistance protein conserved region [Burkholderia vietnamiensis G4]KVR76413.1 fusaric acid resistance protein [Burkholderia vietnamiensis]KVS29681.1 fusaric acid resistance protein [Burkholderia vietnamiensis]MBR8147975.1 FUSC family protein [Burkholderia vietnamiensis]MBR8213868.1 FUSC family protein [Burkholderia vietnamiensis]
MSQATVAPLRPRDPFSIDPRKLLFSVTTFVAAALVLLISFAVSFPRPWWALLTVYVTAQPMAGTFRPKTIYRVAGIATGAIVTVAVAPNLQNSPALLVLCLALWIGFCIYLAVLDRTPRAFLFQMAAFSSAVICFPYLDDPTNIFITAVSRVEEMSVAILCVTIAHRVVKPANNRPVIHERALSFLGDACRWTAEAFGTRHARLEHAHRRKLAADVTELGIIATALPFDQRFALATRDTVTALQHRLAALLSIASAAANRLDQLRALNAVDADTATLVDAVIADLHASQEVGDALDAGLAARCRALAAERLHDSTWTSLLAANLFDRTADFIDTLHAARTLVRSFAASDAELARHLTPADATRRFALARDHGLALLAGAATATAIVIYCAVWILLAWPNGSATAAFAALVTCSFAAQDDPAPMIGRYLVSTLVTFPLAALYLFVILPRVDGAGMLILTLAPALVWMGYIQADPARTARALPMFSCFIVAMGFLDRFQADFALFLNTGLAQVGGIATTLVVSKLFRSASTRWTAYRIVRQNWADLAQMADPRRPLDAATWTARAIDRLGQVATRMAFADPDDALHAVDGLSDLRIGRNIIQAREGLDRGDANTRPAIEAALAQVSNLYRARADARHPIAADATLMRALNRAIAAVARDPAGRDDATLLALVGMRCNLFPHVQLVEGTTR